MTILSALLLSLLVSAAIVCGLFFNIQASRDIERNGVDWTLSLLRVSSDLHLQTPDEQHHYAFVDVSREACRQFLPDNYELVTPTGDGGNTACGYSIPLTTDLMFNLTSAGPLTKASTIVLDANLEPFGQKQSDFIKSISATEGPWVLVPLPMRPLNTPFAHKGHRLAVAQWPNLANGRMRFVAATTTSDEDGVIRRYARTIRVWQDDDAKDQGRARLIPTAPFLAYLLQRNPDGKVADCAYYTPAEAFCQDSAIRRGVEEARSIETYPLRVYYSLPQAPDNKSDGQRNWTSGRFSRIDPSSWLNGHGAFSPNPKDAKAVIGATVVLGSSLNSARDIHNTSVGIMSGGEIILSAVDSLNQYRFDDSREISRQDTFIKMLADKALGSLRVSAVIFPFLVLSQFVRQFIFASSWPTILQRLSGALLACATFMLILTIGFAVEMLEIASAIESGARNGQVVDMITPLLALFVGLYSDLISSITTLLERGFSRVVGIILPVGREMR